MKTVWRLTVIILPKANIELDNTVVNLVPTRGAVVKAAFVTHVGYRVLFNVTQSNGKPAPFGAMATAQLDSGTVSGIVGDNGDLYLAGMPKSGDFYGMGRRWHQAV